MVTKSFPLPLGRVVGVGVVVGTVSVLGAVLAALQSFLRFGESAQQNGQAADWYAAIKRDIDQTLEMPEDLRDDPKAVLDTVRKEMNRAAQKAPEMGERVWGAAARQVGLWIFPRSPSRSAA